MRQLNLRFEEELIKRLAMRPKMKWQWIIKMAHKQWISEYVSDHAAQLKRKTDNV